VILRPIRKGGQKGEEGDALEIQCLGSVLFAGAIDVVLTQDHADNSSAFLDLLLSLAIELYPPRYCSV